MKKMFLPVFLGVLVFLGAGCSSSTPTDQTKDTSAQPATSEATQTPTLDTTTPQTMTWKFSGTLSDAEIQNKQIRIKTAKGDIVFELYPQTAPNTVSNFVYLTQGGFYNNLTFHRREEGFVIQGGDPSGNGTGGPGYKFADELKDSYKYERGTVAMANSGSDTNGSQFFIMLAETPLPKLYSIFGKVTQGMDVVDKIQVGDAMQAVTVEAKK